MAQFRAWLSSMVNAVQSRDGSALEARLDWNDSVAHSCATRQSATAAQLEKLAAESFRTLSSDLAAKWAAFACAHMVAFISDKNAQTTEAFESYAKAMPALRAIIDDDGSAWAEQALVTAVKTFANLAKRIHGQTRAAATDAERAQHVQRGRSALRDACEEIRRIVNHCVRHERVLMLLACTVLLYKLYHRLGSIFLMKDLAEPVSKADTAAVTRCPPGELAAFRFFHGMLLTMDEKLPQARSALETALRLLPAGAAAHRRSVLAYLVPVRMLQGTLPRLDALQRAGLEYYVPIVSAIRQGDPGQLHDALAAEERRFMHAGTYVVLQRLHVLGHRMMLRRMLECQVEDGGSATQISLRTVQAVLQRCGQEYTIEEVECLAANLIARRLAKGYLSHEHKILVVLKGGVAKAFPPIEPGML
eukprot:jgi/Ulvmu1/12816/UM097_0045.1